MFGGDYGHNIVAKRLGPSGYLIEGVLQTVHLVALWSQVLGKRLIGTASYEFTYASGYMNNVYRPVPGEERIRSRTSDRAPPPHPARSLHGMIPTG